MGSTLNPVGQTLSYSYDIGDPKISGSFIELTTSVGDCGGVIYSIFYTDNASTAP